MKVESVFFADKGDDQLETWLRSFSGEDEENWSKVEKYF